MQHSQQALSPVAQPISHDEMYNTEGHRHMAYAHEGHAKILKDELPQQASFASDLVAAMCSSGFHMPLPVLVSLVAMREAFMQNRLGVMSPNNAVFMPFSVVVETPEGDLVRYITPQQMLLRKSWLTFNMSQRNRSAWQAVCKGYGLALVTMDNCGCCILPEAEQAAFMESDTLRLREAVRTAMDTSAESLLLVENLSDIPANNADISSVEVMLFQHMFELLEQCSTANCSPDMAAAKQAHHRLLAITQSAAAVKH